MSIRKFRVAAASVAVALALGSAAFAQPVIVASQANTWRHLTRTETKVQAGAATIDQFTFVRLAKTNPPAGGFRGVIVFLPALGVDFASYEATTPQKNPSAAITHFFADRDLVVYGYSSRAEGLPAGACEAGILDCSPMANWNLDTLLDDIAFLRAQIAATDPNLPVFVGGHSMGGIAALAAVDQAPADYAGVFAIDALLYTADAQVQALNQAYCAGIEAQLAAGIYWEGFGNNLLKKVSKQAELDPNGLTPIPLFPPFLTNQQVLFASLTTPPPGPFSMPVPGYVLAAGDPTTGEFLHTSTARLHENISRFNDYVPMALVRDLSCTLAGLDNSHYTNLENFTGAALGLGGGLSFGPYMQDTFDLMTQATVTLEIQPGFGHVDHLLSADHRDYLERPIFNWLKDHID